MGKIRTGKEAGKIDIALIGYVIAVILTIFLLILMLDGLYHYATHGPILAPLSWFIKQ
jgi:heme/copper-type cytochrome/quinol oxidase subunit 4